MKTVFIFLLIISNNLFSQSILIKTYRNTYSVWNDSIKSYKFDKFIFSDIEFKVEGKLISSNDESKSIYQIFDEKIEDSEKKKVITFYCSDEIKRKCQFSLIIDKIDDKSYIIIDYEKVSYIYSIKSIQ